MIWDPRRSAYQLYHFGGSVYVSPRNFVDSDNMAQSKVQSWCYQWFILITQTNMFKAAGAGAPVVNMDFLLMVEDDGDRE